MVGYSTPATTTITRRGASPPSFCALPRSYRSGGRPPPFVPALVLCVHMSCVAYTRGTQPCATQDKACSASCLEFPFSETGSIKVSPCPPVSECMRGVYDAFYTACKG